eukprot:TRINITY_DN9835_c0_g2_i2.p1 TRINITY_DN9835_c0_g2~~TRINITY_DN9835_c0_g2_i2.p1  ORF type:complete len:127 (+),score=15.08 TRINITY_DN9835_c0_g2_i2:133-513(+)
MQVESRPITSRQHRLEQMAQQNASISAPRGSQSAKTPHRANQNPQDAALLAKIGNQPSPRGSIQENPSAFVGDFASRPESAAKPIRRPHTHRRGRSDEIVLKRVEEAGKILYDVLGRNMKGPPSFA